MDLNPLEKLGQTVRRASDESATPEETVSRAKERALASWPRKSWFVPRPLALVAIAAAAFAGWIAIRRPAVEASITYSVGPADMQGVPGTWIAAGTQAMPLRFSEGTLVTLEPGARARVTGTNAHGATMLVERGKAHAKVVHQGASTSWLVHAGPFDVNVVGTEFDVAWDPTHEIFDIRVSEGKVIVRGPLLDAGRAVSTSEVLHVDVHHKTSEVRMDSAETIPVATTPPPETHDSTPDDSQSKGDGVPADPGPVVSSEKPVVVPTWQKLAAAGKHKEALEAAEQAGFEQILGNASVPVLLQLADEARFAGAHARARQALVRARELGARGRSAFLLGKIAADHDHAPADAIAWFQRYLDESPSGGLAEQALGRIVEIEDKLGHREPARKAAESYLQRYPGGAYETLARRVVEP